ncbi:DUF4232 domain-containing protein [Streptomyces sp. NPDC005355]|uniref:DUF4232 domain-containing protein n=1 Tax=Streptomyces sp. NPDC005355 TaxID=3157038 RepID=UPI0033AA07EE
MDTRPARTPQVPLFPSAARRSRVAALGSLAAAGLLTACGTATPSGLAAVPDAPSAATSTPAGPSPSAPTPPPVCPDSGMLLQTGEADAAMGLRVQEVALVNCGKRARTVQGHPAVQVLDEDLEPVEVEVSHGASAIATIEGFDTATGPVRLKPGERAVMRLVWRNLVTDSTRSAVTGRYLRIAPDGGGARALTVRDDIDLGTTGKLGVSAWDRPTATGGQPGAPSRFP